MTARCRKCGRKLTTPKSIKRGFGPVCYKRMIDEPWKPTERDMSLEPIIQDEEQNGQTIYTRNERETLMALKTGTYDTIIQDEDPEATGAGHAREEKAIWEITREMG